MKPQRWDASVECGDGLHGLPWGTGDLDAMLKHGQIDPSRLRWIVFSAPSNRIVQVWKRKAKVPFARVINVYGNPSDAYDFLIENAPQEYIPAIQAAYDRLIQPETYHVIEERDDIAHRVHLCRKMRWFYLSVWGISFAAASLFNGFVLWSICTILASMFMFSLRRYSYYVNHPERFATAKESKIVDMVGDFCYNPHEEPSNQVSEHQLMRVATPVDETPEHEEPAKIIEHEGCLVSWPTEMSHIKKPVPAKMAETGSKS